MKTGTVKFFNQSKGYGFIVVDDTKEEIFVHANDLKETVGENDRVQFEIQEGKKGLNAANVNKI
ncbi:MAG: cold shock domain-containing protein [Bacteroidetes bacterium]|nr:cold shock domain-containing protein [Bacteroidota bacterium]